MSAYKLKEEKGDSGSGKVKAVQLDRAEKGKERAKITATFYFKEDREIEKKKV